MVPPAISISVLMFSIACRACPPDRPPHGLAVERPSSLAAERDEVSRPVAFGHAATGAPAGRARHVTGVDELLLRSGIVDEAPRVDLDQEFLPPQALDDQAPLAREHRGEVAPDQGCAAARWP